LAEHPAIQSVTASMAIPASNGNGRTLRLKNQPEEEAFSANENLVQPGFVKTYGLEMVQGRDFSKNLETDKRAIIINETAAKKLGVENPVGNEVYNGGYQCKVIGVFKDCHFQSLHHKIEPFILSRRLTRNYFISVRFNPDHAEQAGNHLGKVLTDYDPGYKFQFLYLEDRMENEYARDKRSVHLIMMGTVLAIIISMMGLFALTAFHIDRKIKEIGIRKVMGASAGRITRMLLSHYLKWILLAAMIAFPLSYWFMERWFRNFAYHIQAEWWVFLFSFILAALIASVTVMFKATKAANTNPVNTLKYE
jgi:putative ABC transport system permease protein